MMLDEDDVSLILENKVCEFGVDSRLLYIENNESVKLLVVLSTHNQKNTLFAVRKILSSFTTNLLFLTDYHNSYYLENRDNIEQTTYYREICKYVEKFGAENITIFGSSMAGYAAIKFGTMFDLNVIATNPQLDLEVSYPFAWKELRETFKKVNHFSPISVNQYAGKILVFFGYHPMDCVNHDLFTEIFKTKKNRYAIVRLATQEHSFPFSKNPNFLFKILEIKDLLLSRGDD